jgi:hypothetical protein
MKLVRTFAKAAAWLVGTAVLVLAAWVGINATDEALSDEARAMMVAPALPAADRDNGFLDFLVLGAPAGVPTYEAALERLSAIQNQKGGEAPPPPWGELKLDARLPGLCAFGAVPGETWDNLLPCVEAAAANPQLARAIESHGTFLTVLTVAHRFRAGDRGGALTELERDVAFYRKVLREATWIIDKMVAVAALDRASAFATELARHAPRGDAVVWHRLERLLAPHTREDLQLTAVIRREDAMMVRWMLDRDHARHWDPAAKPWWDALAPYFYRPHQSLNLHATRRNLFVRASGAPLREIPAALETARERSRALEPGLVKRYVFSPAGWNHPNLDYEFSDYVERMHTCAAVQTLARLIVTLREKGISKPEAVEAALAGPIGEAHLDPFTGERMQFDPRTRTVGFERPHMKHISGGLRNLRGRYGRMALPL